ncbi:MAG: hypothetical protein IKG81_12105 [Bacteroidales bacterium]|nr:hypothetical protein [Bacteroidales bacterium]
MELIGNKSSLLLLGDDNYSRRFQSEKSKFIGSTKWKNRLDGFFREMKQQVAAGDLEALKKFLRDYRSDVLNTFKTKGCYYVWERCYVREKNVFDGGAFLRKLELIASDKEVDENELNDTFTYICLTENIDNILAYVLALEKSQKTPGNIIQVLSSHIAINQGIIIINQTNSNEEAKVFSEDEEVLSNLIFIDKYFYDNHRLHRLRNEIGRSIDLKDYNGVFGCLERKRINPEVQSEWYYISKAIIESGVAKRHSVSDFLDQMSRWYPTAFEGTGTLKEKKKLFNRMGKSISHEKSLWQINKGEVVKIEDMWARFSRLHLDKKKVEYVQPIAYGLLLGLRKLKNEMERENVI